MKGPGACTARAPIALATMAFASLALASVASCAPAARAPTSSSPARPASPPPAPLAPAWRYDVVVGEGARELSIEADLPASFTGELALDQGTERFLGPVELAAGGAFVRLEPERATGDGAHPAEAAICYRLPTCPPPGCRLRYRFDLARAAAAIGTLTGAAIQGDLVLSPPSAWLLHPVDPPPGEPFLLRVHAPPGLAFATGLFRAPGSDLDTYAADLSDLSRAPYSAFGALRVVPIEVAGQRLELAFPPGAFAVGEAALRGWVEQNARIVADFCGRAPLRRTLILLLPEDGRGIRFAQVLGNGGATIVVPLGRSTTADDLATSWELLHEMLHTAFPNMPSEQAWLEEGMATYLEPLLRARRGLISGEEAFHRLARRMENGLPAPGDRGLDRTRTWGRIYWGGALFCLLVDLDIRQRTGGARSLDDALRAIVADGGNVSDRWPLAQVIAVGDAALGVPALAELHAKMGSAPMDVDLPALWAKLGVIPGDDGVRFDDRAPLAAVRRAMLARR